ncbi:hypothetical protein phiST2_0022 [Vibrio phage phi-ST2]|nr:hypothetical protein phiST2_0022 [Vibrio phage phi-ST2]
MRKLVYGVGINDVPRVTVDERKLYVTWTSMLQRAYDPEYKRRFHTYDSVSVCQEWHTLSVFREWFNKNYVPTWQLDKDLICIDNDIYSPSMCAFVPRYLNNLENDSGASRGDLPIGVCYNKQHGKFQSNVSNSGKLKFLGYFDTPEEASLAHDNAKRAYVLYEIIPRAIEDDVDGRVIESLKRRYKYNKTNIGDKNEVIQ